MLNPDTNQRIRFQRRSVNSDYAIAGFHAGLFGGASGHDALHQLGMIEGKVLIVEAQFHRHRLLAVECPKSAVKDGAGSEQQGQRCQERFPK
jgi:hypothetical protein